MLEGFRRVVGKSSDGKSRWDVNIGLPSETVDETAQGEVLAFEEPPVFSVYDPRQETDYYANVVRASIQAGGRHAGHEIPVNWLRMILAGLEGRDTSIDLMLMVPRAGSVESPEDLVPKAYSDIFPSR